MKRILREPLLHFALLGTLLFALHAWLRPAEARSPERIVVSAGQVESLVVTFARVWQRPPTAQELRDLVRDHVEEEVLAREAIALGLDRDDTVIRRRLRQKMEFVAEDLAVTDEPSEAELREHLRQHRERFLEEPRTSFRHVFLGEEPGEALQEPARALLARLRAAGPEADASGLGRSILLPGELELERRSAVAARFGDAFAAALGRVPVGEWSGPLRSAYGSHLVLVTERDEERLPPLDEIREDVRRELIDERRALAQRRFLETLLARYEVRVEWPAVEGEGAAAGDVVGAGGAGR